MIIYKHWFIPLLILLILVGAWFTRWDTVATKSKTNVVIKWDKDQWTGSFYTKEYRYSSWDGSSSIVSHPKNPYRSTTNATNIWIGAVLIDGIWLIIGYRKERQLYLENNC